MTSSAWWAHPGAPVVNLNTWWLILSSHGFWSLPAGEGVMGSSVVTRSCRARGLKSFPSQRWSPV